MPVETVLKMIKNKSKECAVFEEKCIKCYIYRSFIAKESAMVKKEGYSKLLKLISEYIKFCMAKPLLTLEKNIEQEQEHVNKIEEQITKSSDQMLFKSYCYLEYYFLNKEQYKQSCVKKCANARCLDCLLYQAYRTNELKKETNENNKQLKECTTCLNRIKGKNLVEVQNKDEVTKELEEKITKLSQKVPLSERKRQWDKKYLERETEIVSAWENYKYDNFRGV